MKSCVDMAFAGRMEFAAKQAGNATRLAESTGISRRAIGDYLSGNAEPSRPRLIAIAAAAGVRLEWLATGQGPVFPDGDREGKVSSDLDVSALEAVIAAVEDHLRQRRQAISPDAKAALVTTLYKWAVDEKSKDLAFSPSTVEQLIVLVSKRA
ncbi:MAG: helix-turn-helix domain-containing protein [Magnetospirillum sp.]|nr:helix-turn-helix domain-containing protein [Magnetospirillum sp.]